MAGSAPPFTSTRAVRTMVAAADHAATQAGMAAFALGGNAVDAAIATNAAMTVTSPHLCGMGGDLFALVHADGEVHALNATGRAGAGTDATALRADGHTEMPFRHDIRTVTLPGCVDGWRALHERFASLSMADLLAPAIRLAEDGFAASPLLVSSLAGLDDTARTRFRELIEQAGRPGDVVRRPGVARALRAIVEHGRNGFYLGEFGDGLRQLGGGLYTDDDLRTPTSEWVTALSQPAFGKLLHTMPPNSQGYLTLGAAALVDALGAPADPDDAQWAHLLIEASSVAGHDRPVVLHDRADGRALLDRILADLLKVDTTTASRIATPTSSGDTTYVCSVDQQRMGVSLIQSNASGFGSWLVEPNTGINLHNRGLGFALTAGHPAEIAAGRRPPHTLSPAIATNPDGSLAAVFGTMGGDAQPQILLQLATRLFLHGASPAEAINAGRWVLHGPNTGFDTWTTATGPHVVVEGHSSEDWVDGLEQRGHEVRIAAPYDGGFGHAHVIVVEPRGTLAGAADPRARIGSVAGL